MHKFQNTLFFKNQITFGQLQCSYFFQFEPKLFLLATERRVLRHV